MAANKYLQQATGAFRVVSGSDLSTSVALPLQYISSVLSSNITTTSTSVWATGQQVSQGSSGTWFVTAYVSVQNGGGSGYLEARITDSSTAGQVPALTYATMVSANSPSVVTLSGIFTSPSSNLQLQVINFTPSVSMIMNGLLSGIAAVRIG